MIQEVVSGSVPTLIFGAVIALSGVLEKPDASNGISADRPATERVVVTGADWIIVTPDDVQLEAGSEDEMVGSGWMYRDNGDRSITLVVNPEIEYEVFAGSFIGEPPANPFVVWPAETTELVVELTRQGKIDQAARKVAEAELVFRGLDVTYAERLEAITRIGTEIWNAAPGN